MSGGGSKSLGDLASHFIVLGLTTFGGPAVHLGMFQDLFVEKLQWFSSTRYVELIAMANCLPGPSSTQVAFAIGITQHGVIGGLTSGFLFLLPGAIAMTGLGFVSSSFQEQIEEPLSLPNAIASACSAVGVALVFIAVTQLVKKTTVQGRLPSVICFVTGALCLCVSPLPPWLNPVLIFLGGLTTIIFPVSHADTSAALEHPGQVGLPVWAGFAVFLLYLAVAAFTVYATTYDHGWQLPFLTAGMFVWGGGPVVLPFLMTVLTPTFVPPAIFLTGIALAEMMPGPVFNMSCFLGVQLALASGYPWQLGTILCWAGLVGPGVTLIFGAMPLWNKLRSFEAYQRALPGLNGAAVGLLVSTIFLVYAAMNERSPWPKGSTALALVSYAAIDILKLDVPTVVIVAGLIGWAWFAAGHPGI